LLVASVTLMTLVSTFSMLLEPVSDVGVAADTGMTTIENIMTTASKIISFFFIFLTPFIMVFFLL
jgi:hypothetical protein